MTRSFRQGFEIGEARRSPDLAAVRIDRHDTTGKAEALEIVKDASRPVVGAIRRPDQHDIARVEQPLDGGVPGFHIRPRSAANASGVLDPLERPKSWAI